MPLSEGRAWLGDAPVFLVVQGPPRLENGETHMAFAIIDIDEPGWIAKIQDLFRLPSIWSLFRKFPKERLITVRLEEGEQAYWTIHNVMIQQGVPQPVLTRFYGLGKKRVDGNQDNAWWEPLIGVVNGSVDDTDILAEVFAKGLHVEV